MIEAVLEWAAYFGGNVAESARELGSLGLSALAVGFGARMGWSYADNLIRRNDRGEDHGRS